MPHLSSQPLAEPVRKSLEDKLVDIIGYIGRERKYSHTLRELLTETEMTMLAKRLAIIYMIDKGQSTLNVADTLNVSTSTVQKIEKVVDRNGYRNIRKVLRKLEPSLLEIVETFMSATLDKYQGKGRLSILNKMN